MILIIRISGLVEMSKIAQETLFRMHLKRKYSAILLEKTPENLKLIQSIRNFVAFGEIDEKLVKELISTRGKSYEQKPYFRLHPPRGGINTKEHFPKGILGHNPKISELVRRML